MQSDLQTDAMNGIPTYGFVGTAFMPSAEEGLQLTLIGNDSKNNWIPKAPIESIDVAVRQVREDRKKGRQFTQ